MEAEATLFSRIRYAEDVLDQHWPNVKCPICESEGPWGTIDRGAAVLLHEPAGAVAQGFPTVFRYCMTCGFVRHHSVAVLND